MSAVIERRGEHYGRSWERHPLEDVCPCPKAPCGLIDSSTNTAACDQHGMWAARTMRQHHWADECPGPGGDGGVLNLRVFRKPGSRSSRGLVALPSDVVRVDRPRKFSNPWRVGKHPPGYHGHNRWAETREEAIAHFRRALEVRLRIEPEYLAPLKDKRLACWCAPLPCHADVLLELANR